MLFPCQVPLLGKGSIVGVLEMAGGSWTSGQSFTCQLFAIWPGGQVCMQSVFSFSLL